MSAPLTGSSSDEEDEILPSSKPEAEARKAAYGYAWEYFKYHAQQRQAAFRFYVIISGALFAALTTPIVAASKSYQFMLGLAVMFFSFLFWKLDARNKYLIHCAEAYLKIEEENLFVELRSPAIRILHNADLKKASFSSYSRIHMVIFISVGAAGFLIALPVLCEIKPVVWLTQSASPGATPHP